MLQAIDRRTPTGKRNFAIMLLLATCGLRAREVAGLTLRSIDWRGKRLQVPERKAAHSTVFPLSPVVGVAVVDYLRNARPDSSEQALFLCSRPPFRPVSFALVSGRSARWLRKAGIQVRRARISPICICTTPSICGCGGISRASRSSGMRMILCAIAGRKPRRTFSRQPWSGVSQNADWNCIRRRRRLCTAKMTVGARTSLRQGATFWGTRFGPGGFDAGEGDYSWDSTRESARKRPRPSGRKCGTGDCQDAPTGPFTTCPRCSPRRSAAGSTITAPFANRRCIPR